MIARDRLWPALEGLGSRVARGGRYLLGGRFGLGGLGSSLAARYILVRVS